MTLQQLRYLIAIAEFGSINAAAQNLYASQSNLSNAVKDLEREFGITIFTRSNRGVTLTNEGTDLLGYARQVIEQADMLEEHYSHKNEARHRLAISTQHYAFSVEAFVRMVEQLNDQDNFDYILRECATGQIIEDLRTFRSELGILYLDTFNRHVMEKAISDADLVFTPLFDARVHVFVGENHPLAKKSLIELKDLEPYPRYSFEQGSANSFYYAEEPFAQLPHTGNIRYSDRGTLTNLLTSFRGYTLSTGVLSAEMNNGIVSIPLNTDDTMRVGYLMHKDRKPDELLQRYIDMLKQVVSENPTVTAG
jgi:DNA-binding transcriptional LysR family regulator